MRVIGKDSCFPGKKECTLVLSVQEVVWRSLGCAPSPWTAVVCWDAHSHSLGDLWAGVFLACSVWGVLWTWPMQMYPGFVL